VREGEVLNSGPHVASESMLSSLKEEIDILDKDTAEPSRLTNNGFGRAKWMRSDASSSLEHSPRSEKSLTLNGTNDFWRE